jgi:hypothetical protein
MVGLPPRPFLYTLDQLAGLLSVSVPTVKHRYIFYEGYTSGHPPINLMIAHNINDSNESPAWRVTEQELVRWMRHKGIRFYDRTWGRK